MYLKRALVVDGPFPVMNQFRLQLPPGPSFLLQQLLSTKVVGYVALVGCIRVGGELIDMDLPLWAIVSSSIAALPVILHAQSELRYWSDKRKAESLGARLAPKVPHKWPAGIDLIPRSINTFRFGYLGEPYNFRSSSPESLTGNTTGDDLVEWMAERGRTIDFRNLGESHVRVLTTANLMKLILVVDRDNGAAVH